MSVCNVCAGDIELSDLVLSSEGVNIDEAFGVKGIIYNQMPYEKQPIIAILAKAYGGPGIPFFDVGV